MEASYETKVLSWRKHIYMGKLRGCLNLAHVRGAGATHSEGKCLNHSPCPGSPPPAPLSSMGKARVQGSLLLGYGSFKFRAKEEVGAEREAFCEPATCPLSRGGMLGGGLPF